MKEYCFNRCDRLVASSLLTLLQTLDLGGSTPLMRGQTSSAVGWSVLHILSQRLVTNEVEREWLECDEIGFKSKRLDPRHKIGYWNVMIWRWYGMYRIKSTLEWPQICKYELVRGIMDKVMNEADIHHHQWEDYICWQPSQCTEALALRLHRRQCLNCKRVVLLSAIPPITDWLSFTKGNQPQSFAQSCKNWFLDTLLLICCRQHQRKRSLSFPFEKRYKKF